MRDISIVVPTIPGRERYLNRCIAGYKRTAPRAQVLIVRGQPSCGLAWEAGLEQARGRYVHLTADDIVPHANWWKPAIKCVDNGGVPVAEVVDAARRPLYCDAPLGKLGTFPNILIPFLSREQLELGGWVIPTHYGTDDWVTYRAVRLGLKVEQVKGYKFTHHVAKQGRNYGRRAWDVHELCKYMRADGYLPPPYARVDRSLGLQKLSAYIK